MSILKSITNFMTSGLAVNQWCQQNGLNIKNYYYWMRKIKREAFNVYTHVGLEDAEKELQKMQGLENARKEMGFSDKDDKPLKQNMFKVV